MNTALSNSIQCTEVFKAITRATYNIDGAKYLLVGPNGAPNEVYTGALDRIKGDLINSSMVMFSINDNDKKYFIDMFPTNDRGWGLFFQRFGAPNFGKDGEGFARVVQKVREMSEHWLAYIKRVNSIRGDYFSATLSTSVDDLINDLSNMMNLSIWGDIHPQFMMDWCNVKEISLEQLVSTYARR